MFVVNPKWKDFKVFKYFLMLVRIYIIIQLEVFPQNLTSEIKSILFSCLKMLTLFQIILVWNSNLKCIILILWYPPLCLIKKKKKYLLTLSDYIL